VKGTGRKIIVGMPCYNKDTWLRGVSEYLNSPPPTRRARLGWNR